MPLQKNAQAPPDQKIKNIVHSLYNVKNLPLEGPKSVMEVMKKEHGFQATKAQYEKYLKEWGFCRKNRKGNDYKILDLNLRKRKGKDSDVYDDGVLIPKKKLRKEISRHGVMTIQEQLKMSQASPPPLPPGLQIRTPAAQQVTRLCFWNLPILRFQGSIENLAEALNTSGSSEYAIVPLLGLSGNTPGSDAVISRLDSLLPNASLSEEPSAIGLAISRTLGIGMMQSLSLATFIISNALPGQSDGSNIYRWLQDKDAFNLLRAIKSTGSFTGKAVLENVFRLAIENGDLQMVKNLLNVGVDPNGPKCRHSLVPDKMSPLQFALVDGNLEIAYELIKAGSFIDQPGLGWKSSALVLAIIGWNSSGTRGTSKRAWEPRPDSDPWNPGHGYVLSSFIDVESDLGKEESIYKTHIFSERSDLKIQEENIQDNGKPLLKMVQALTEAGADINCTYTDSGAIGDAQSTGKGIFSLLQNGHSPLTAAAMYRHGEIIKYLIEKGGDPGLKTRRGTTALQECLYNWEEMRWDWGKSRSHTILGENDADGPPLRRRRPPSFRGGREESTIECIVNSLLEAGADVLRSTLYNFHEAVDAADLGTKNLITSAFSPLELAVYTESDKTLKSILSRGAKVTELAVKIAIWQPCKSAFTILLKAEDFLCSRIVRLVAQTALGYPRKWVWELLMEIPQTDLIIRRNAMTEAIRNGWPDLIDIVLERDSKETDSSPLLETSPTLTAAIEQCCDRSFSEDIDVLNRILSPSFESRPAVVLSLHRSFQNATLSTNNFLFIDILSATFEGENALSFDPYQMSLLNAVRVDDTSPVGMFLKANIFLTHRLNSCYVPKHRHLAGSELVTAMFRGDDAVVDGLLQMGADINTPGSSSAGQMGCSCKTPLTAAIIHGDSALIWRLIDGGAKLDNPPELEYCATPLAAAVHKRDLPLTKFLLIHGADPEDEVAVQFASQDPELFWIILNAIRSRTNTPKHSSLGYRAIIQAVQDKDLERVKLILDSQLVDIEFIQPRRPGPDGSNISSIFPNYPNVFMDTWSVLYDLIFLSSFSLQDVLAVVLPFGVDLNSIVHVGEEAVSSALLVAVYCGEVDRVRILLEAGADPDRPFVPNMCSSALQLAVWKRNAPMVRLLLEFRADANAASPWGAQIGTPIQLAASAGVSDITQDLLRHGANPDATTLSVPHTGLQIATRQGDIELVRILLEHGANVNAAPAVSYGATALQYAAAGGFLGIAHLLLQYGAVVDAAPADIEGRTALEAAAEHGRIDMVQLLLNSGADIYTDQFERALERAAENGHFATVELLQSFKDPI